jgi:hypothetical protein
MLFLGFYPPPICAKILTNKDLTSNYS